MRVLAFVALLLACVAVVGSASPTGAQRRSRTMAALLWIDVQPRRDPQVLCVGETKELLVRTTLIAASDIRDIGGMLMGSNYITQSVTNSDGALLAVRRKEAMPDNYGIVEPYKGERYDITGKKPGTGQLIIKSTLPAGWTGWNYVRQSLGPQPAQHATATVSYKVRHCDYKVSTVQTMTAPGGFVAMTMDDVQVTADDSGLLSGVGVPEWVIRVHGLPCTVRTTIQEPRPVKVIGQFEDDGTLALDLDHADVSVGMAMRCPRRLMGVSRDWTDTWGLSDRHITVPGDGGAVSSVVSLPGHRETASITVEPVERQAVAAANSRLLFAPVEVSPSPEPAASPPPSGVELTIEVADGPFDLLDPTVGLADRGSYVASLTNTFEGTIAGEPVSASTTATMRVGRSGRELTIERRPDGPTTWRAEIKGFAYAKEGDGQCTAGLVADGESLADLYEPAAELPPVFGASEAVSETVDGGPARHHTFDEASLVLPGPATVTGDVWVAEGDGRVLGYQARVEAGPELLGEDVTGTRSIDYTLSIPERTPAISLPADCPPPVDAPVLKGATDVVRRPGMMSFRSSSAIARAVRSYTRQLRDKGWKATFPAEVTKSTGLLGFRKGKRDLTVVLRRRDGKTMVHVAVTR